MLNINVRSGGSAGFYRDIGGDVLAPVLGALESFPKECRGVIWQSVKRTMMTVRKDLVKEIKSVSYLKSKRIQEAVGFVQMYGSATAGSKKMTNYDHVSGAITVNSKQLPLDAFKIRPNRPTHPRGRKFRRNMELSGYQIGPRDPVRYKPRTQERSAGFVVVSSKGFRFLVGLTGKYHRAPNGNLHQSLLRASGYSVQYFASFENVYWPIEQKMKGVFIERLNHEVQYRLQKLGGK